MKYEWMSTQKKKKNKGGYMAKTSCNWVGWDVYVLHFLTLSLWIDGQTNRPMDRPTG